MRRFPFSPPIVLLLAAVLHGLTACGDAPERDTGAEASDGVWRPGSGGAPAGAEVVEHAAIPEGLEVWRFAEAPAMSIGASGGGGPDVFGSVTGVARRSDGVILAGDGQAAELRAFSPEGEHLWTAGGSGSGPGEFDALGTGQGPALLGDSAVAVDLADGRAEVFDRDGTYARGFVLEPPRVPVGGVRLLQGVLAGGGVVTASPVSQAAPETGYRRQERALSIHEPDGPARATVGIFPASEFAVVETGDPDGSLTGRGVAMGRTTVFSVAGDRIAAAPQDRFDIFVFDGEGEPVRVVRVDVEPVAVDAGVRARYVEAGLEGVQDPQRRAEVRESREQAPYPETLPVLERVLLDTEGRLWVAEWVAPYEEADARWWVIDRAGEFVAHVQVPSDFVPHRIEADEVIGVRRDALDVPYVEVRRIERP